ncbi:hypothetical protein ACOTVJ_02785 [Aliarcobacter butzleri]|uniref:hypothetical protein n=1 Tax=Aliarcobacter butzleri TaxID=28197 RepID=UPI00126069A7|nr:hypothetical protein [Aliarcobacter butzleri]
MKKVLISVAVANIILLSNVEASFKETANSAMFWKSEHLENIDFASMYPKAFYKKRYFSFAVTGIVIVGGVAFSYFTAGAGAPVAATGVSSIASYVGGGGAGSYMAGLSTIGGYFGGNAILGGAILNGVSLGTIGGGTTFASASIFGKLAIILSANAMALDGVYLVKNPETNELEYRLQVQIPKNLGSKRTREFVDNIYSTKEKISKVQEEIKDKDYMEKSENKEIEKLALKRDTLNKNLEAYNDEIFKLLEVYIKEDKNNQEDLLVLGVIAYNNYKYDIFSQAINKIDKSKLKNTGFLNYLLAIENLIKKDVESAKSNLVNSIDENQYAIEPVILYINLLAEDFEKNEEKILSYVKKIDDDFDSDKYQTNYSLASIYNRLGTIYFNSERYSKANEYYKKAIDNLSFFGSSDVKHLIQIQQANALYKDGKINMADKTYKDILDDLDNESEKTMFKEQYLGNFNE